MGRPQAVIDAEQLQLLRAADLTWNEICAVLKISKATLYTHIQNKPELQEAWDRGPELGTASLKRKAFEMAVKGNATMLQFQLRKRAPGYEDTLTTFNRHEHLHKTLTEDEIRARLEQLRPEAVKYLAAQSQEATNAGQSEQPINGHDRSSVVVVRAESQDGADQLSARSSDKTRRRTRKRTVKARPRSASRSNRKANGKSNGAAQ